VIFVTLVGMKFTFDYLKKAEPMGPMASPMLQDTYRMLPPSPRLQVLPHMELEQYCALQQQNVSSYGWVNQPSGVVHIPVDRAMDLVLQRGLPARPASDVPASEASADAMPPTVSGGADVLGQCGYLAEEPANVAPTEGSASK